jgi:hypothetical protein
MTEDLAAYFADWGEAGLIDGVAVVGIFAAPYSADPLGGAGMSTSEPRFLLASASVPPRATAPDADPVLELPTRHAAGLTWRYVVREVAPDGSMPAAGCTSLTLVKHQSQV